jgi:predicted secreted protein
MTNQDYQNKATELSNKYNTPIKVGMNYENKACLELLNADKANTLKEMKVAQGFRIGFNAFGSTYTV